MESKGFMFAGKEKKEEKLNQLWKNPQWVAQEKFDGSRYQLNEGNLHSRKISVKTDEYTDKTKNVPHIIKQVKQITGDLKGLVIDGEIVHPQGWGSSQAVMGSLPERAAEWQEKHGHVLYQVFDILYLHGEKVWKKPYRARHDLLLRLFGDPLDWEEVGSDKQVIFVPPIYTEEKTKREIYHKILRRGGEGVILKDLESPYIFDRSKSWIKIKKQNTYDVVVTGFLPASEWYAEPGTKGADGVFYKEGRRTKFFEKGWIGAIEFGLWDPKQGKPVVVGQCSGISDEVREDMSKNPKKYIGQVMEIICQERMPTGGFRHPNFLRMRDDKGVKECLG